MAMIRVSQKTHQRLKNLMRIAKAQGKSGHRPVLAIAGEYGTVTYDAVIRFLLDSVKVHP